MTVETLTTEELFKEEETATTEELFGSPETATTEELFGKEDKTPIFERLGKGFGTGVAGMVEGAGGVAKWFGADKIGDSVNKYANEMKEFYEVPDPDFTSQVAAGFGSMSTFLIPGLGVSRGVQALSTMPRLAAWLGASASSVMEASVEAGGAYNRSVAKGMEHKEASSAATKDFWLNLPLLVFTNKAGIFGEQGGAILKGIKSSGSEGIQEFTQQLIGNFATKDPLMEGALESAAVGAIVGGGTGALLGAAERKEIEKIKVKDVEGIEQETVTITPEAQQTPSPEQAKEFEGIVQNTIKAPIVEPAKDLQGKEEVVEPTPEALKAEARKYKTADEFVESDFVDDMFLKQQDKEIKESVSRAEKILPKDLLKEYGIGGIFPESMSWNAMKRFDSRTEEMIRKTYNYFASKKDLPLADEVRLGNDALDPLKNIQIHLEGNSNLDSKTLSKTKNAWQLASELFIKETSVPETKINKENLTALWHEARKEGQAHGVKPIIDEQKVKESITKDYDRIESEALRRFQEAYGEKIGKQNSRAFVENLFNDKDKFIRMVQADQPIGRAIFEDMFNINLPNGKRATAEIVDKFVSENKYLSLVKEEPISFTTERYGMGGGKTVLTETSEAQATIEKGQGYGTIESSEKATKERPAKTDYSKIAEGMPTEKFDILDETLKLVSPASRKGAKLGARIFRKNLAAMTQRQVVVTEALKKSHRAFTWMNKEDNYDFIDRMENGLEQKTPELQAISLKFRGFLDQRRTDVQNLGKGHLETFIENYFPHIWKDPKKAKDVIAQIMGRKRIEGSKSFLKQRKIPTTKEGIERGLEPVSDNPVDLVLLKIHEMDRYIMAQNLIRDLKGRGLLKFVYARSQAPQGYIKVNDNAFTVFMPPEITKKDYYDQTLVEQMMDVARSLGVDTRRFVNIGGQRTGYAQWYPGQQGGEKIRTKFSSPESVLAHEIGHILGYRYDLYNLLGRRMEGETRVHQRGKKAGKEYFKPSAEAVEYRRNIDAQWRALADARKQRKEYARSSREKEAVLLEALIHAPDEFKLVAPNLYDVFTKFLNETGDLRPLLDIKPSLTLGANEAKIKIPGFTTLGHFYAPEATATILNNYLSPGLRNSNNKLIAGSYNLIRGAGNILNQAQLAFSLFHGLNTASDMAVSTFGLGLRKLTTKGQFIQGLTNIATSPISPITNIWNGMRIRKAYTQSIDTIKDDYLRSMVETIISAGGRDRMDIFYYNQQVKALEKTIHDVIKGSPLEKATGIIKLPFNLIGSFLEVSAKPLMEWYVPSGKIGMFAKMAEHEMQRAEEGQIDDDQLMQRLTSVWDSVDNRMGELVYDNLFWNKLLKDVSMLSIRSVGWNLGSWREYGGAVTNIATTKQRLEEGDIWFSHKMAYTVGAVVGYSIVGAVIQYLLTGEPPEEPKDYLFPKTGNKNPDGSNERLSLPTYAKDWYAWGTQPIQTATHKIHPLWGLLGDLVTNKDFFNVEIRHEDDPVLNQIGQVLAHIGDNFKSLSVKNYEKFQEAEPQNNIKNIFVSLTGIASAPSYISKTPAQKLMTRLIVEHIPPASKTKEEFEKSIYRRTLKTRLRKGEAVDVNEAINMLGKRGYEKAKKESKLPPFAESFKRLSIKDALNVYAISSTDEQAQVKDILKQKYINANSETKTEDIKEFYQELITH